MSVTNLTYRILAEERDFEIMRLLMTRSVYAIDESMSG